VLNKLFSHGLFYLQPLHAIGQTQHLQIEWSKTNALLDAEGKTISVPTFKNAIHSSANHFLPTRLITLPIQGETIILFPSQMNNSHLLNYLPAMLISTHYNSRQHKCFNH
jgi:hypothetical protein